MNPARSLSSEEILNAIRYLDPDIGDNSNRSPLPVDAEPSGLRARLDQPVFSCATYQKSRLQYLVLFSRIIACMIIHAILWPGNQLRRALKGRR